MLEKNCVGDCAEHQNRISASTEYNNCLYLNQTTYFTLIIQRYIFYSLSDLFLMQPCVCCVIFPFFLSIILSCALNNHIGRINNWIWLLSIYEIENKFLYNYARGDSNKIYRFWHVVIWLCDINIKRNQKF